MTKRVAYRELIAEPTASSRVTIVVRIDTPQQQADSSWVCSASVEGLPHRPFDAHGTDSLQALLLAIRNVREYLERFVKDGGRLYWPGDEQAGPMSVAELFSDGA
jgi:hypothetical protein